ncbi:MAG: hypothetical protein ABIE43_00100 [Patescibacteria group bacterium]
MLKRNNKSAAKIYKEKEILSLCFKLGKKWKEMNSKSLIIAEKET